MEHRPRLASTSRVSCATYNMKAITFSGVPVNLARKSSRCVAMPVGQVFM